MRCPRPAVSLAALLAVGGCAVGGPDEADPVSSLEISAPGSDLHFSRIESPEVHRLLQLDEQLYSGAEPKTEAAFAALQDLGIRTVVSVDGARPKVDLASRYGMDYVQIPIGYDGISQEQAWAMVHVVRARPGPYYFHCHHGRHRGPAAAAIALRALTGADASAGSEVLLTAGTSENYPGLWRDVEAFQLPPAGALLPELVAVATISDLASGMASMDRTWDQMKEIQAAEWASSAAHPDLDPHQVALILRQAFEAVRDSAEPDLAGQEAFRDDLELGLEASALLEEALSEGNQEAAAAAYADVARSCKSCHSEYRNG